jgi:hypothetical protein
MKSLACLTSIAVWLAITTGVKASPPLGAYALVEKVVMEPNDSRPERVQIWGVFALTKSGGPDHEPPARGYLYFQAPPGKEDLCRREWNNLKQLAGTGQCVAFAGRFGPDPVGRLRRTSQRPQEPDTYPLSVGVIRLRDNGWQARELRSLPATLTPADGGSAEAGKVTLVAGNILDKERRNAKYVFEITNATGEKETSAPIPAGDVETRWTPRMEVRGQTPYTWRVWATEGTWKGPVATAEFTGKASGR